MAIKKSVYNIAPIHYIFERVKNQLDLYNKYSVGLYTISQEGFNTASKCEKLWENLLRKVIRTARS